MQLTLPRGPLGVEPCDPAEVYGVERVGGVVVVGREVEEALVRRQAAVEEGALAHRRAGLGQVEGSSWKPIKYIFIWKYTCTAHMLRN